MTVRMRPRPRLAADTAPAKENSGNVRSAIIAGVSAAVVSGLFSYYTVHQQVESETERTVKSQRQSVYAQLLTDHQALDLVEDRFAAMWNQRRPVAELTEQVKRGDDAFVKFAASANTATLIAPHDLSLITIRLLGTHQNSNLFMTIAERDEANGQMTDATRKTLSETLDSFRVQADTQSEEFFFEARRNFEG